MPGLLSSPSSSSPVTPLPKRPRLAWTPEKLEEGNVNIVIHRGYSSYSGLRWKNKSREREYLTRLCRSLIDYGAPAHHLEGKREMMLFISPREIKGRMLMSY